jgi:hypothetical protein
MSGWLAVLLLLAGTGLARAQAPAAPVPHDHDAPAGPAAEKAKRNTAPADAYVYIGWPNDGEVIRGTRFRIWFGTRNFGVAPAGVTVPFAGHHHLLVDAVPTNLDEPIPNDRNHLHFGLGQTEAVIDLPPGTHTLQLLMGDGEHVSFDPPVTSKKITVTIRP